MLARLPTGHPATCVRNKQQDVFAIRHTTGEVIRLLTSLIREHVIGRLDLDMPTIWHGVSRVDDQVENRILKLIRIAQALLEIRRKGCFYRCAWPSRVAENILHSLNQSV